MNSILSLLLANYYLKLTAHYQNGLGSVIPYLSKHSYSIYICAYFTKYILILMDIGVSYQACPFTIERIMFCM